MKGRLKDKARRLKREVAALTLAAKDRRTPFLAKALVIIALAYALSPIDLIPDFIPVLGQLDDLLIVPALLALAIRLVPADVLLECRNQAAENELKPNKNWAMGAIFIILWLLVLFWIGKLVWKMVRANGH